MLAQAAPGHRDSAAIRVREGSSWRGDRRAAQRAAQPWPAQCFGSSTLQQAPAVQLLDLVIVGLSVAPPGYDGSLVQLPPLGACQRCQAAAARMAALLRLASAAAARFLQQQLSLPGVRPLVRRLWVTPGGRLAAHVALTTPVAAQVLARKRHSLRGSPYSVDLLRDQVSLAVWRLEREQLLTMPPQQGAAAGPPLDGPATAAQQSGAGGAAPCVPHRLSPLTLTLLFLSTILIFSCAILLICPHCSSRVLLSLGWQPP